MKKIFIIVLLLGITYVGIQSLLSEEPKTETTEVEPAPQAVAALPQPPKAPGSPTTPAPAASSAVDEIRKLTSEEKWYDALEKVNEYLKTNPKDPWALELGGMLLLSKMEKPEEALPYFQKYLDENPSSVFVIDRIMEIGDRTENLDRSFEILKKVDEKSPGIPNLELVLADGFMAKGDPNKAREYYRKSTQGEEQRASAFRRLGRLETDAGNYKVAVESYRSAMSRLEQEKTVAAQSGQPTKYAEQSLNYTRLDLIETLIKAKDYETAKKELEAAQEYFPSDHPPLKKLQDQLDS